MVTAKQINYLLLVTTKHKGKYFSFTSKLVLFDKNVKTKNNDQFHNPFKEYKIKSRVIATPRTHNKWLFKARFNFLCLFVAFKQHCARTCIFIIRNIKTCWCKISIIYLSDYSEHELNRLLSIEKIKSLFISFHAAYWCGKVFNH